MSDHGTTVEWIPDWRERASCKGDAESFDLDVIGNDPVAISRALNACEACPSRLPCATFTNNLPAGAKPQDQVMAGRVWTKSRAILRDLNAVCRHGMAKGSPACARCVRRRERDRIRQQIVRKSDGIATKTSAKGAS